MRPKNRKQFIFLLALTFILSIYPAASHASIKIDAGDFLKTILKEVAKGNNSTTPPANLSKSETKPTKQQGFLRAYFPDGAGWIWYIIEKEPIKKSDGSIWHKMIFEVHNGQLYYQVNKQDRSQYDYDSPASFSYPYINAKQIKKTSLSPGDIEAINYFNNGRPCKTKVGDNLFKDGFPDFYFTTITKRPLVLYTEPIRSAKKITLPSKTKVISPSSETESPPIGAHLDMDDTLWIPIANVNNKVMGWAEGDNNNFWDSFGDYTPNR